MKWDEKSRKKNKYLLRDLPSNFSETIRQIFLHDFEKNLKDHEIRYLSPFNKGFLDSCNSAKGFGLGFCGFGLKAIKLGANR